MALVKKIGDFIDHRYHGEFCSVKSDEYLICTSAVAGDRDNLLLWILYQT